jgi:hypothetical protein
LFKDLLGTQLLNFKFLLSKLCLPQVKSRPRERNSEINSNPNREFRAVNANNCLKGSFWPAHSALGINNDWKLLVRTREPSVGKQFAKSQRKITNCIGG